MQPTEPTVFVVDDDRDLRRTLGWLVQSIGLRVETFESAAGFLAAYTPERPGVLVLDVRLHGMSGLELLERLGGADAPLPIIMMTGYGDFQMAVRALKGGAIDIFQKPFDDQEVLERIRQAIESDSETRRARSAKTSVQARLKTLTPRERAVLELLIAGKTSKEIAVDLDLSVRTVESHRAHIMEKMDVDTATKLVATVLQARVGPA
jgi:FixJ family two-component response regulator